MNKIEKIQAEIERLYDGEAPKHDQQCDFDDGYFTGIGAISQFLDTLSEEPDKSLKEVAEKYADETYYAYPPEFLDFVKEEIRDAFIAGAKWQTNHTPLPEDTVLFQKGVEEGKRLMREEAVEGYVNYYEDSGGILMAEAQVGCPYHNGDKVRVIVLPKEGKNTTDNL